MVMQNNIGVLVLIAAVNIFKIMTTSTMSLVSRKYPLNHKYRGCIYPTDALRSNTLKHYDPIEHIRYLDKTSTRDFNTKWIYMVLYSQPLP